MKNIKLSVLCVLTFCLVFIGQIYGQSDFQKFANKFNTVKAFPVIIKTERYNYAKKMISNKAAIQYLQVLVEDTLFNDFLYNMDDDISTDNWIGKDIFVDAKFISNGNMCFIYTCGYSHSEGLGSDNYSTMLKIFTNEGKLLSEIPIGYVATINGDETDTDDKIISSVFLNDSTFRTFVYRINKDNYTIKDGIIYSKAFDENKSTIIEISDYKIKKDGNIILITKHPIIYGKCNVDYYMDIVPNKRCPSDPMNEYIAK